ncbi:hypothetical protein VTK56DRAFT_1006 [Thermocarpiscus australiensis]
MSNLQQNKMSAAQGTKYTRRSILRFGLASVCIDNRPRVYKDPQLVLKPQLDLAPRRPYTGSRPRMPVWRHFLMVHVKDKADELVKLELGAFKQSPVPLDPVLQHTVSCLYSDCSLNFRYPNDTESEPCTLKITLQKGSDLEAVLRELTALSVNIAYERAGQDRTMRTGPAYPGQFLAPDGAVPTLRQPFSSSLRHLNSSSPPLTASSSSQDRYSSSSEGHLHGAIFLRPPSQPTRHSASQQLSQRPWSPASVPSRPATTIGIPGILGEGIYKVSRIGSAASARPRVRRTPTLLEHQGPRLYTVSKHFEKTLSSGDIVHSSSLGRSSSVLSDETAPGPARYPSPNSSEAGSQYKPGQENPIAPQPLMRMPSVSEGVLARHQARLRRLRTISAASGSDFSAGFNGKGALFGRGLRTTADEVDRFLPTGLAEGEVESAFSQPETTSQGVPPAGDAFITYSNPDLLGVTAKQEMEDEYLLQISLIQHEGLCEASRIWDDFTEKACAEIESTKSSTVVFDVLSKYEQEFVQRWDNIVAATAQKMRAARARKFAI